MNYIDAVSEFAHLVPGCPEPEAVRALRYSCIEFAERTSVMTQWLETTSDLMTFDFATAGVQIVNVFDAFADGWRVSVVPLNAPQMLRATDAVPVVVHGADMNTTLAVVPTPQIEVEVRLLAHLVPTPDSQSFSDSLWRLYRETVIDGAIRRLLAAPGTAYVDKASAGEALERFERKTSEVAAFASSMRLTPARRLRVTHADGFRAEDRAEWASLVSPPNLHQIWWTASDAWIATNYWM